MSELELLQGQVEVLLEDQRHCIAAAQLFPFRAGDVVKHAPTGETWVLACDQRDNDVIACGWPETMARAMHCRLVRVATDEERLKTLRECARGGGTRATLAAGDLARSEGSGA